VASADELRVLRETLATRSRPQADPLRDLGALNAEMVMRAEKALADVWPAESAPRENAELVFEPAGPKLRVRYKAAKDLDAAAVEAVTKSLQAKMGNSQLRLEAMREAPPRAGRQR
jgi:hypothetical protein